MWKKGTVLRSMTRSHGQHWQDYRESKKASANFLGSRSLNFVDKPETERAISAGLETMEVLKRYDARRESRGSSKSLDLSTNKDTSRFPIVRRVSELLGQNAPHISLILKPTFAS
ncbi:hypothetical protein DY000_02027766 [Brassica cretica]|uniref:Uncharacterized protein n=1 Tax=Brassica cretica TaxID=69181 RepID=A0ABQ7E1M2_BRACR|nr:hypothetical protein DY000_02027766 [Brassica cretica]